MSYEPKYELGTSKLTPELMTTFCRVMTMGNYPKVCCAAVGIHISTYRTWMRQGADHNEIGKDSVYREFYMRVQLAEAESENTAVEAWKKHFPSNYKAARDFLARRFSSRWGPTFKITLEVEKEIGRLMEKLAEKLPSDIYQQVIVALADAQEELSEDPEDGEDEFIAMAFQEATHE